MLFTRLRIALDSEEATGGPLATQGVARFEFGANWRRFLSLVDARRIADAEASLREMLEMDDLRGRGFLDIGSGSGLFSLAAAGLGAARIHSFDFDSESVRCTAELRRRYAPTGARWTVERGSALDPDYVEALGEWDIVYSWGVLHHTGDMERALELAARAVRPGGKLYIAIYNDQGARSRLWRRVKRTYNWLPRAFRRPYAVAVMLPRETLSAASKLAQGHPEAYWRSWTRYADSRGMSRWHDLLDWVGGYPYEVASPEDIVEFGKAHGFTLTKLRTAGVTWGCNEYVLERSRGTPGQDGQRPN
jgi:2-polyprenyl-6-hydroxyphenyl methylase/3-demethylubiquinone-9 3-methyltransferase